MKYLLHFLFGLWLLTSCSKKKEEVKPVISATELIKGRWTIVKYNSKFYRDGVQFGEGSDTMSMPVEFTGTIYMINEGDSLERGPYTITQNNGKNFIEYSLRSSPNQVEEAEITAISNTDMTWLMRKEETDSRGHFLKEEYYEFKK